MVLKMMIRVLKMMMVMTMTMTMMVMTMMMMMMMMMMRMMMEFISAHTNPPFKANTNTLYHIANDFLSQSEFPAHFLQGVSLRLSCSWLHPLLLSLVMVSLLQSVCKLISVAIASCHGDSMVAMLMTSSLYI